MLLTKVIDPVCGMNVKPENSTITSDYNGEQYYFCSATCKQQFDNNPGQYKKEPTKETEHCCHTKSKESFDLLVLPISGMSCHSCAHLIEQELSRLHGVNNVNVNFNSARAVVDINPAIINANQVKTAIAELGYQVLEKIA